jgi:aminoglycoside phosphotransferase (APT) family kinase protein
MPPSEYWDASRSWEDFIQESPNFATIDRDQVRLVASRLRPGKSCSLSPKFTHGTANAVFQIDFDDGIAWICRVRKVDPDEHPHYAKMITESTVATMVYVKQNTTIPVPNIHSYESDPKASKIGSSFILMDAVSGGKRDQNRENISDDALRHIYTQIADTSVQLARLNFSKIGRIYQTTKDQFEVGPFVEPDGAEYGPFATAVEYYTFLADKDKLERYSRTYTEHGQPEKVRDRFASHLYCKAATTLSFANTGPFSISHGDFGIHNILFDNDYDMTGLVDWELSHAAPALTLCAFPALIQICWAFIGEYWPGVLERLLKRQGYFHGGVRRAEQTEPVLKFEGEFMSDIVGSDSASIAQILGELSWHPGYKDYDGMKVFQFLYGDADFNEARELFARLR